MAKFGDGKQASESSTGENPQRWEALDLDNLPKINVVTDDDEDTESPITIEVESDQVKEEPKDALSDDVVEHSERVPEGRAQKRIIDLANKNREKDQELQRLREELHRAHQDRDTQKTSEVDARKESTKSLIDSYTKEYETAALNGDVKAQAAITSKMTKANVELIALENFKPVQKQEPSRTQEQPNRYTNQREAVLDKLPEAGQKWAEKNKWFVTNPTLTQHAIGIASEVEADGFTPEEPEYYEEIEKKMAELYPSRFGKVTKEVAKVVEEPKVQERKQSPVAAASKTSPTQKAGTVRLTKEEVALAKKWRIPLERFAAEKKKLDQADKNGSKTTTIFE